jgi:Protein kinase domain/PEGA domain
LSIFDWFGSARPASRRRTRRTRRKASSAKACPNCSAPLPEAARFCFLCGRDVEAEAGQFSYTPGSDGDALAELRARLAHSLQGRYTVRDVLGVGGMGVVFLADDLTLDRAVAIKVLPPQLSDDATVVERFHREAKTAARLEHPGIIPIYRVESEGGLHYFIMKYVAGRSLDAVLLEESPLSVPFATRILRDAAAALGYAHRRGVVHRDVKPGNIMLDAEDRLVLTDFGISKASGADSAATTQPQLTSLGTVLGTPYYMAPEQAVGQSVDGRADQYALAVVGFEMLVGRVPFDDETSHGIIHQHINEPPPDVAAQRPEVPRRVAATIARAMRKAPASRFGTMEEFAAALADPTPMDGSSTTAGVAAVRTRRLDAAAVLGAEDQELDSALDRVFDGGTGRRRRRSLALRLMVALLILCALAAGTVWAGTKWRPVRRILERAALMPRTVPAKASSSKTTPPAAPRVAHAGAAAAASPPPKTSTTKSNAVKGVRRTALLSITSSPRATVLLDGVKIGETPISGRALTVGRTYRIQLERKGYRTKRETVTVTGTRPIRRSYTLQKGPRR